MKACREFQVFAKPAGAVCNLDCRYCYYLGKQQLYPTGGSFRMNDSLLETYIAQHIAASAGPTVTFSWHGGEPTVLGVDYFRKVVALQRKHRPPGCEIVNGIQTNGTLLDEAWGDFLSAERFRVGLSLDGPPELHDPYRVTKGRRPTHRQVMRAFQLLQRRQIPCDILCVVHDRNVHHPTRVYRFFKEIGARSLGFLPLVAPAHDAEGGVSPETPRAGAYGEFLCTIFDEWVRRDVGEIFVQMFEEASRPLRGLEHSLCVFRETCGEIPVVEHNGDFYCCDHFVDTQHRLGNIRETPLVELLESPAQRRFGEAKRDRLPRYCRTCPVLPMCNGGCPKDRFLRTPDGEGGLNYLCVGFKRFFTHMLSYANERRVFPKGRELPSAGRNDSCPCGSGKKYKKCCLAKSRRV